MAAQDKEPDTDQLEGSDAETSESYVNGGGFASPRPGSTTSGVEMTTAQKNAVRLRDCVNPADLAMLLSEVWNPNPKKPEPLSVDPGEGVVRNLDVSELLFFSKKLCKKLISFVGFHQTDSNAKNAAIDVFTWFCTQPALLKSLFVSSEVICNWALSLAIDKDPAVAAAGLRGLVHLANHEIYRATLHENDKLIRVLDQIDLEKEEGRNAATLAFIMFHTLILSEGRLKNHDALVQKLEDLSVEPRLSSAEEQYWELNCLQAAVILSEHRVELMDLLAPKLVSQMLSDSMKQPLLDEQVNAYLSLLHQCELHKEDLLIDRMLSSREVIAKLFKCLTSDSEQKQGILKLLAIVAKEPPHLVFDEFLDDNLLMLEKLMEEGSPEVKSLVLNLLAAISHTPVPKQKKSLHHEQGLRLLKLLQKDIDEKKLQILSFIWTHYKDTKQAFIEAGVVSTMLSLYTKTQTTVTDGASSKLKKIMCTLLEDSGAEASEIQDKVLEGLTTILTSCDNKQAAHSLQLALGVLTEFTIDGSSSKVMNWLVEEGLAAIITAISKLAKKDTNPTLYSGFHTTLEKLIDSSAGSEMDRRFFLKKFVMVVKAIDIWPSLGCAIQNHPWMQEFSTTHPVKNLSLPSDVSFGTLSLSVLGAVIQANQQDHKGFLCFLLQVLLELGLSKASASEVQNSGISRVLAQMLCSWKSVSTKEDTSHVFLHCVAAAIRADSQTFTSCNESYEGYGNLWNLIIESGRDVCYDDEARLSLMSFLRDSHSRRYY